MYFLKPSGMALDSIQSMAQHVQYGMITGAGMHSFLRLMGGVYSPQVFKESVSWPESVRKDFTGQFHKFMATLTETTHEADGKTVLYLPGNLQDLRSDPSSQENKDAVRQLESVVIHWTRQIKQVHHTALPSQLIHARTFRL